MKKLLVVILVICMAISLVACAGKTPDENEVFTPSLDTNTNCSITVVGSYDNFEALEAEFDRFNEFYPNVELSYTYLDNYKKSITTALASQNPPDIFTTFPWMLDKTNSWNSA